jgi:ubiquinone/menaquinone biosynthesis C-methylase UbiE
MKTYEMHAVMYQKIKDEGQLSWDRSISFDEMWSHSTNVYLKKFLTKTHIGFSGLKVLDLGTGTGTSALYPESAAINFQDRLSSGHHGLFPEF